jgi:hypothetical protein
MNVDQVGSFRTRIADDGSLEVWARGWRLESQVYALIPMALSLMFLVAPMPLGMRAGGAIVMLVASLLVFRMTKPGLFLSNDGVSIVSVVRTRRYAWDVVGGFQGERRHDEGRVLLVLGDGVQIPLPGTLDPGELDPYGDEGEVLSAVDQLNRFGERARAGDLPKPAVPSVLAEDPETSARKDRRSERKELRAALKAVRVPSKAKPSGEQTEEEPPRSRRRRAKRDDDAPELTPVTVTEPEQVEVSSGPPRRREPKAETSGLPSYFPKPTYIPQAEYAQMLREQKAAEKAAAAAAAELRELADLNERAERDEFSDWASDR